MNMIQNGTTNVVIVQSGGITFDVMPGSSLQSRLPVSYTGVTYPTVSNTTCVVLVGVNGVVESPRNNPDIGFGKGMFIGMTAAFASAVVIMFLRGAKAFFRGHSGSGGE